MDTAGIENEEFAAAEMTMTEESLREFYREGFFRSKAAYLEARATYKNKRDTYEHNRNAYLDICLKGIVERINTREKRELETLLREIVIGSEDDPIEISTESMFDYMRLLIFGHI